MTTTDQPRTETPVMDAQTKAAERRARQGRKRMRDWYRSMMDCGEPGLCGDECRVCRHFAFEEWVATVGKGGFGYSVTYDPDVVAYINRTYPWHRTNK